MDHPQQSRAYRNSADLSSAEKVRGRAEELTSEIIAK